MLKTKIVSSLEKCFIDTHIDDYAVIERLSALKNERFSFQIICTDDSNPSVSMPLFSVELHGKLAKYASVREVMSVPVQLPVFPWQTTDNYLRTTPGLYPDLLQPLRYGNKLRVTEKKLSSLWIEIDLREVDDDAICGESELSVSFINEGKACCENTVTVDIINANLPEQDLIFTEWFHTDCLANYYGVEAFSEEHWRIIENFAKTAVSNGINLLLTPTFTPPLDTAVGGERLTTQLIGVTKTGDNYSFDFSLLDRWVDMCDRVGVKYLEIAHFFTQWGARHAPKVMATVDGEYKKIFGWETDSTSDEYVCFLRTFITEFLTHMKARGDDKRCFFHVSDEPPLEYLDQYKAAKDSIKDLLEGYVIMDALSNYEFFSQGVVETPIPSNDHVKTFIDHGVENLWTYYCCGQWGDVSNRFVAMPSARTRSIGMQMYKYNIVGFLHWGYNFYNTQWSYSPIDPYLELSGDGWVPAGDTFSVYPAPDGSAYEALRITIFYDALQDMRAMKLAESLCGKETVVKTIENAFGKSVEFTVCPRTPEEMQRVRDAVNLLIKNNI